MTSTQTDRQRPRKSYSESFRVAWLASIAWKFHTIHANQPGCARPSEIHGDGMFLSSLSSASPKATRDLRCRALMTPENSCLLVGACSLLSYTLKKLGNVKSATNHAWQFVECNVFKQYSSKVVTAQRLPYMPAPSYTCICACMIEIGICIGHAMHDDAIDIGHDIVHMVDQDNCASSFAVRNCCQVHVIASSESHNCRMVYTYM